MFLPVCGSLQKGDLILSKPSSTSATISLVKFEKKSSMTFLITEMRYIVGLDLFGKTQANTNFFT